MSKKPKKFRKRKKTESKVAEHKPKVVSKELKKGKEVVITSQSVKRILSFSFKIDLRRVLSRNFFEFFVESFLMTGILLLLYIVFSLLIQTSLATLTPLEDSYQVHAFPNVTSQAPEFSSLPAYIVYEKDSRVVVDGKNEHYRFSPASTAKVMTALISLEHYNLDTVLTARNLFSTQAVVLGSKMGLVEGEKMTVQNLLYGLLLPSGNDAAFVLAENYLPADRHGPGGVRGFVAAMNEKAATLKLESTHFQDPAGFEDENYTTAFDLARLTGAAVENPTFKTIVGTKEKVIYNTISGFPHELVNLNELLGEDGVNGVKTGFTNEAGGVLITSDLHQGKTYIIVVMKSNDRFADTRSILSRIVNAIQLVSY